MVKDTSCVSLLLSSSSLVTETVHLPRNKETRYLLWISNQSSETRRAPRVKEAQTGNRVKTSSARHSLCTILFEVRFSAEAESAVGDEEEAAQVVLQAVRVRDAAAVLRARKEAEGTRPGVQTVVDRRGGNHDLRDARETTVNAGNHSRAREQNVVFGCIWPAW